MTDRDPRALFTYAATKLDSLGLAYLHIIEPRIKGSELVPERQTEAATKQIRTVYQGRIITAGGFEPDTAEAIIASGVADAVAFGRYFVSNPDLPQRIKDHLPLAKYDRGTFYTFDARGYTDYPFYEREITPARPPTRACESVTQFQKEMVRINHALGGRFQRETSGVNRPQAGYIC
jgi:N-ethylmaleimide reductase